MSRGTHAEHILDLLARTPGLDDDEIALALSIEPRQTVNQICRGLATRGALVRERGPNSKIVNRPSVARVDHPVHRTFRGTDPEPRRSRDAAALSPGRALVPLNPTRTLLIIPCSRAKQNRTGTGKRGASISEQLPTGLAQELREARERVRCKIFIMTPLWSRLGSATTERSITPDDRRSLTLHGPVVTSSY